MALSMADVDNEREKLEAKIAKYRRLVLQVDELTAGRIRSLIDDMEKTLQQQTRWPGSNSGSKGE
jgi:hypothetical protein